ncbi:phage I-like protein [Azospirillum agricola]|uniref:hypothetical protein n=1 Tax=Azospirillum agricola TaxID=1720247 RepID=UPI001AE25275|nr:hypothetical protein [Azospirillum agricola]MBP2232490.1 phage I-like protein [Azospirillum agricola]
MRTIGDTEVTVLSVLNDGGLRNLRKAAAFSASMAAVAEALGEPSESYSKFADELHGRYLDLACA